MPAQMLVSLGALAITTCVCYVVQMLGEGRHAWVTRLKSVGVLLARVRRSRPTSSVQDFAGSRVESQGNDIQLALRARAHVPAFWQILPE